MLCSSALCESISRKNDRSTAPPYLAIVDEVLLALDRCLDPVMGARLMLASVEATERLHGLQTLAALPRLAMPKVMEAEAAAARVAVKIAFEESRNLSERALAYWSTFTLCLRNGEELLDSLRFLETQSSAPHDTPLFQICTGRLDMHDGLSLLIATSAMDVLFFALMGQCQSGAIWSRQEKMFNDLLTNLAIPATAACPTARFETLLSLLLKATASEDVMVASAALGTLFYFAIDIQERSNIMTEANIAGICVETLRRTGGFRKEAPWWKERAHQWSIEIVSLIGPWVFLHCLIGNFSGSGMPHGSAWDAILAEATHGTIVIHRAELALAQSQGDGRAQGSATGILRVTWSL